MIAASSALLLLAAAVAAWLVAAAARPGVRIQLRFAAALVATCPVAVIVTPLAAPAVALLVVPIAIGVLALAALAGFGRPMQPQLASALLGGVCLCDIAGIMTAFVPLALGAAVVAALALLLICARSLRRSRVAAAQGAVSALCFMAAQSVFVIDRVSVAFLLFTACGLLGVTLALARSGLAVEQPSLGDLRAGSISRGRDGGRLRPMIHQDLS